MISIIIPTYNEEKTISRTLERLSFYKNIELIVVDGGSLDRTVEFVKKYPVKIIQSTQNRAIQMNQGAQRASGDVFLFLHSDCSLEDGVISEIDNFIDRGYIGGCLRQKIDSNNLIYRFIENSGNIRAKCFKLFYGDQGIFVCRDTFFKVRGFDKVRLFEDVLFSKKISREGRVCILNKKIYTSSRRWESQGLIKATAINWLLSLGFIFGISPNILKKVYHDVR